jgi:hypothetical protein
MVPLHCRPHYWTHYIILPIQNDRKIHVFTKMHGLNILIDMLEIITPITLKGWDVNVVRMV